MAAKAPSTMEAMASAVTTCCHCGLMPAKRAERHAHQQRHGRHLGRGGEEGRDRRRRALVDVGRPHVERHGRDLEGEADQQEHEADDEADVLAGAAGLGARRRWPRSWSSR